MRYSLLFLFLFSCNNDYTPKPRAYLKLGYLKEYLIFENSDFFI